MPIYVRPKPVPERPASTWHSLARVPISGWDPKCREVHWSPTDKLEFSDKLPFGSVRCPKCAELDVALV